MKKNNILIGITTHKREELCVNLLESILVDDEKFNPTIFVYKDGTEFPFDSKEFLKIRKSVFFKEGAENRGVGFAKNEIIEFFKKGDFEHLFIIEDDVIIKDIKVFDYFVKFSEHSGLRNLCWHGCVDWVKKSLRLCYQYDGVGSPAKDYFNKEGAFVGEIYGNCAGSFQYFHQDIIDSFKMDLNYINAWEHIDVELQLSMKGINPPFWSFVSPGGCDVYLGMQDHGGDSTITGQPKYEENKKAGWEHFFKKWGFGVNSIPKVSCEMTLDVIKYLKSKKDDNQKS